MNKVPEFYSFQDFYPYYLSEHSNPTCRALHYIGTVLGSVFLVLALLTQNLWFLVLYPLCGYSFAWVGHFAFEKNKPATFNYPIWSLMGDYKMLWMAFNGTLDPFLKEAFAKYGK